MKSQVPLVSSRDLTGFCFKEKLGAAIHPGFHVSWQMLRCLTSLEGTQRHRAVVSQPLPIHCDSALKGPASLFMFPVLGHDTPVDGIMHVRRSFASRLP